MSGGYRAVPQGMEAIIQRFEKIERRLDALAGKAGIRNAILPDGAAIKTADFDGTDFADPGTAGNYFAGDGCVLNALKLRPGSVDNDALTNPVRADSIYVTASDFALTTTGTTPLATQTWQVPEGMTTLVATLTGRVFAFNSTTGLDYLYGRVSVGGLYGSALPVAVTANSGSGTSISPYSGRLEELTAGQDVTFYVQGWTAFAGWSANVNNVADISGTLLWFR